MSFGYHINITDKQKQLLRCNITGASKSVAGKSFVARTRKVAPSVVAYSMHTAVTVILVTLVHVCDTPQQIPVTSAFKSAMQ